MKFVGRLRDGFRRLVAGAEEGEGVVAAAPVVPVGEVFRRFWPHARPYRLWLPLVLFFIALVPAIETATIWMYKVLVDEVLIPREFGLLLWVILAYIGLQFAEGVATFCDEYLSDWVGGRFIVSLRTEFFAHLHKLSLAFFDRERLGDVMSRVTDDVEEIEALMLSGMASAISYVFQLLFFTAALFYLNWQLAIVSLFVVPLFWLAARHFSRKIKTAAREERRRSGSIGAVAEESLSNVALVQAYNRQDEEVARFHRENEGSFQAQMAATRLASLFSPLINMIELAGVVVVVAFGAYQLSRGNLTVGGLLVFLVFLGQLYSPIRGISSLLNSFYSASAGAERIIEFLDEKPSVTEREDAVELRRAEGRVAFDGVSFRYPDAGKPALEGVFLRRARGDARARGAFGGGEVHGGEAHAPLLRPGCGIYPARRPRPARPDHSLAARERRRLPAGDAGLRRDGAGEHRLREAGGDGGGDRGRRQGRCRPRLYRSASGGIRHARRPEGTSPLRRAAPAARHSAGDGPGRAGAGARRADDGS